jgi:phosphoserine phosphatase
MPLMPGAKKCFDWIHQHNISTAIISAGIKTLATIVSKTLGITYVYANELLADDNGYLTGEGIVEVPLKQKDQTVLTIHKKMGIPFEEMVAVGNSCYDIPMLLSVGLAVVFHPADECVRDYADEIINEKDLSVLKQVLINYQY